VGGGKKGVGQEREEGGVERRRICADQKIEKGGEIGSGGAGEELPEGSRRALARLGVPALADVRRSMSLPDIGLETNAGLN
jgi:hypothetical protein